MTASSVKLNSALILKLKIGVDTKGNDLYKNITLKKVKASAPDQDVFDVAQAITFILRAPLESVLRQNVDEIVNR